MINYGICLSPFLTESNRDLTRLAQEVEGHGFSGVFVPEAVNDGLMCCAAIARVTDTLHIASWISNIYLRQPSLCAAAAAMVQEESGGRFVLGLGVSHRPMLEAQGLAMGDARGYLRRYLNTVRTMLRGDPVGNLRVRLPLAPVPIHVAALALETVRLGAELADGVMLDNCSVERLARAIETAHKTLGRFGRTADSLKITCGLLVFLHDDRSLAYQAARVALARYAMLPAYNRMFARSGFAAQTKAIADAARRNDFNAAVAAVNDAMVESLAVAGPSSLCRERLRAYENIGTVSLILRPSPVAEDYTAGVSRSLRALASIL
jgi:alkanesulfonate monooxygenase SsuD/methylene tetrahydromethanopterin reductase-like flavin-dependent oxidoreductase (luciferase family)